MGAIEDKSSENNEDSARINKEAGSQNVGTKLEGNVLPSDFNKKCEIIGATSENEPQSATSTAIESTKIDSGEATDDTLNDNLEKLDKMSSKTTIKSINPDTSKDTGDYTAKTKVSDETDKKSDVGIGNIDSNEATTSNSDSIGKKDESNDLDDIDKIEIKMGDDDADQADEVEDDDMELRWEDDDGSDPPLTDGNGKFTAVKQDYLSEEQLLKESDINAENPEIKPDKDILTEKSVKKGDDILSGDKLLKEVNTKTSDTTPEINISLMKSEGKLLEETNINTESLENSPEMDSPVEKIDDDNHPKEQLLEGTCITTEDSEMCHEMDDCVEKTVDKSTDDLLEDKLLEGTDTSTEGVELNLEMEIPTEKSVDKNTDNHSDDKLLEVTDTSIASSELSPKMDIPIEESIVKDTDNLSEDKPSPNLSDEDITEKEAEENEEGLIENKLLLESENNPETKIVGAKCVEECKKTVLEESDRNDESFEITPETNQPVSIKISLDENDDVRLDNKPLEDTVDVLMKEIDKELKDHESGGDYCIAMDVDNTNPSIDEQAKMEGDSVVQPMDEAEVEKKNTDQPMVDQGKKKLDQSIGAKNKKKIIDQPIFDTSNLEKKIIEKPIDDQAQREGDHIDKPMDDQIEVEENIINPPIDDQVKLIEENKDKSNDQANIEDKVTDDQDKVKDKKLDQPIVDEAKIKDNAKMEKKNIDEPIDHTNIAEQTDSLSVMDTHTDPNIPNVQMEDLEKLTQKTTLETEVENKLEPEKITSEEITETTKEDSNLTKINMSDQFSIDTSSICLEDSPVRIKTDHGLHKPDMMLEIPTQELIDMDDTDLSMNLDRTEEIDSPIDEEINISADDIVNDETVNKEAIVAEVVVGKDKTDVSNIAGVQRTEDDEKVKDCVVQETIEESMEKMFAEDEPVKAVTECTATKTQHPQDLDAKPSTSFIAMTPDTSDEVPEVSDSLGLLAESSGRLMEDDEDPEDDDEADDDDDFDQDESSNQISAEQSEDSNPPLLEAGPVTDEKEIETPDIKDVEFQFTIEENDLQTQDKVEKMEIDVQFGTVELQAESLNDEETKSAVDALLKDVEGGSKEEVEDIQDTTDQMDIETVKLSDTSDNEVELDTTLVEQQNIPEESMKATEEKTTSPAKQSSSNQSPCKQSPSKMKKLEIKTMDAIHVVNIVDLEESSSSEDDIQEIQKQPDLTTPPPEDKPTSPDPETVTNVNIPTSIEIMCTSGGTTSEMVTKEGEVVISGIPKPPPHKPARLNTSEVSIKTASNTEPIVIPETKINDSTPTETQSKPKLSLEIFSLDSDEEDGAAKAKPTTTSPHKMTALELEKARETSKCINYCCTSDNKVPYKMADASTVAYYDAGRKRRSMVCQPCADVVANRTKNLIKGIKNLTPLLDLEMGKLSQDLVEISDSESEDEETTPEEPKESIGEKGAKFLEDNLAKLLNETWRKYDMDTRLKETQIMLDDEIEKLEQDSKEIDAMLNECQVATDKLRCDLYATFEHRRYELPAVIFYDTPDYKYIGPEAEPAPPAADSAETRQAKRRMSSSSETPAKRPAIPLGYAPLDADTSSSKEPKTTSPATDIKLAADDDKDISVVKLSAESAPADLPPPGEISRPPLRVSMPVYAMKNAFGPWLKGRILEIQPKSASTGSPFSLCRVKFDHKAKTNGKVLAARSVAYAEPADVRMTIGTRLIALFKDSNKRESYYSGVVAEIPNPVNNYRYLVFFDDGYAQYVQHAFTRLVCESSPLVWEEVHPFSREFVREYLLAYPERPMVRLHEGQHLKTEWNGKWWSSRVLRVDASLAQVMFVGDGRREWIYRGSTRLAPLYLELRAAERHRPRPMPRSKAQPRSNMPYVEYTRSDEQESSKQPDVQVLEQQQQQSENFDQEIRRQRAVAKKSTSVPVVAPPPQQPVAGNLDTVTSRVVYYTPKNAVRPYKMTPHRCGPKCKRSDVLSLKELRTYNPLAKPLLSGWERQIVRFKGHKGVLYRAPCGRRLRGLRELHAYLRASGSDLPVDLFDFHYSTHCLAEFVLNKCLVGKKDLSHGKENVPVPCVNYYDESLPEFCSYNTERTPTAGVPLNLDPEFLCGCDCTDDCQDKSKCACWKMTLEGARTIGLDGPSVGYVYKRLPEPLPSGIYECNSRCKCKHTCLNRVAQHPLQLKLQVFKTLNRGWGIRALNDVPKGSFLCVYAGNLLTDATANLDGLNEGDEYLAELDYIEVVEQMKEGYEEDIPEADKKLDKKKEIKEEDNDDEEDEPPSSDEDGSASKTDKEDDDFQPGYIGLGVMEFNKRLRRREKSKKDKEAAVSEKEKEKEKETKETNAEEDCITISDDEEVREPSRFTVQAGMGANVFISKYKSVRTLFGKDEACYIMDAKVQGNIGRYLNHSCCPNVFVQNVFVDTHDPRFPWVAFFALSHIKAGTELTWNYNYDVGSVPGKVLYCYCGAPNCRGRLL